MNSQDIGAFLKNAILEFISFTSFANAEWGHLIMILVGLFFIWLAIKYEFEPLLSYPSALVCSSATFPSKTTALQIGIYEEGSVMNILYQA